MPTQPRAYRDYKHLCAAIESDAGRIVVQPLRANDIHFDIAWSSSYPANLPNASNGSSVLDIGRGVMIRATGNVVRVGDGWNVQHFTASQYPSGRDLTPPMATRACGVIGQLIGQWAATHEGDIAQADDIDRSNGARTLEEYLARHEAAVDILRGQLTACEEGEPFTQYPDLPTDGR